MSGGREIKFRLWNPTAKEFHYWGYLDGDHSYSGPPTGTVMTIGYGRKNSEQFTGLKDKNGKEIYEGDIVILNGVHRTPRDLYTVDYVWGDFLFERNLRDYHSSTPFSDEDEVHIDHCISGDGSLAWVEVVGNLHETPEMLQ